MDGSMDFKQHISHLLVRRLGIRRVCGVRGSDRGFFLGRLAGVVMR